MASTAGERIKERRVALGLSQEQVAEAISSTRQAISLWETNQREMTTEYLPGLCEVLGMEIEEILFGTMPKTKISAERLALVMSRVNSVFGKRASLLGEERLAKLYVYLYQNDEQFTDDQVHSLVDLM